MTLILLTLTSFLYSLESFSQVYKPITTPVGNGDKIYIRGFKGSLKIVQGKVNVLTVETQKTGGSTLNQWKVQVRRKTNNVEIVTKGLSEMEDWEKIKGGQGIPTFALKVTVPQLPTEIFWEKGEISVINHQAPLKIQMTEGKILADKGKGPLMIQLINGSIKVNDHRGDIGIQTFKGNTVLSKINGNLSINNHSSTYVISDHFGSVELKNHSGTFAFKNTKGSMDMKNISGTMKFHQFEGNFEGETKKGFIYVAANKLHSFVIDSENSAVTLKTPDNSGAQVEIRSKRGHLHAPSHFRKKRRGPWTELRGHLKGKVQGRVKIISKYGDIVIK